jgi:hypothetical protein
VTLKGICSLGLCALSGRSLHHGRVDKVEQAGEYQACLSFLYIFSKGTALYKYIHAEKPCMDHAVEDWPSTLCSS